MPDFHQAVLTPEFEAFLEARLANPQSPEETWTGIGRSPKWVQAILDERGIDVAAFKGIPMYQIHA